MPKKEQHSRDWIIADDEFEMRYLEKYLRITMEELDRVVSRVGEFVPTIRRELEVIRQHEASNTSVQQREPSSNNNRNG